MDQPLGVRLVAEALGTFLFFFLGFSGIAVVVDIGADAITPIGVVLGLTAIVAGSRYVATGNEKITRMIGRGAV